MPVRQRTAATPLGPLTVTARDGAIVALDWGPAAAEADTPLLAAAVEQIDAYFHRRLSAFDLPLAPDGTPFQQAVWNAMRHIPYGATRSYADLARHVGTIPRAVGGACGRNPIPILIPCHRVLAQGRLGGYSGAGGPDTKRFLLALEGAILPLDDAPRPVSPRS